MTLEVDLGFASPFLYYDTETQRLSTIDNTLENKYSGTYTITITVGDET